MEELTRPKPQPKTCLENLKQRHFRKPKIESKIRIANSKISNYCKGGEGKCSFSAKITRIEVLSFSFLKSQPVNQSPSLSLRIALFTNVYAQATELISLHSSKLVNKCG